MFLFFCVLSTVVSATPVKAEAATSLQVVSERRVVTHPVPSSGGKNIACGALLGTAQDELGRTVTEGQHRQHSASAEAADVQVPPGYLCTGRQE